MGKKDIKSQVTSVSGQVQVHRLLQQWNLNMFCGGGSGGGSGQGGGGNS